MLGSDLEGSEVGSWELGVGRIEDGWQMDGRYAKLANRHSEQVGVFLSVR